MFLKLETKLAMPVPAIDHAGAGEGVPGAGGEITSGSGSHHAGFEAASPYPLEHYPTYPAMILLPPTMSAGHDAVSIVSQGTVVQVGGLVGTCSYIGTGRWLALM